MDCQTSTAERFAAWSDLVSLFLVGATICTSGLNPTVSVARPPLKQTILSSISMVLLILFSAVRFIIEGIFVTTGPREFLVIGVVYLSRWLWLFASIRNSGTAKRGFYVAFVLLDLPIVRFGKSTFPSRRMADEIVLRKGKARQGQPIKRETQYWRGFVQSEQYYDSSSVWVVELVEEGLHARKLKKFGVLAYKQESNPVELDDIFQIIYRLIMKVEIRNQSFQIGFEPFFSTYDRVSSEAPVSVRTGCSDDGSLADVARRVAWDACDYIRDEDAEFQTPRQVRLINECIQDSISRFVGEDLNINVYSRTVLE